MECPAQFSGVIETILALTVCLKFYKRCGADDDVTANTEMRSVWTCLTHMVSY